MPSVVIGSKIFADLFGKAAMRELFSDASSVQGYLDVEAALGIIPAEAAEAIGRYARVEDGHGQWCHWGATRQDIMDTADVPQMRRALDLIAADITWHSIRDNFAETSGYLALLAGSIGKIVYDCCRRAHGGDSSFADALAGDARVSAVLSRAQSDELVDPAAYLGAAPQMVRRLLERRGTARD